MKTRNNGCYYRWSNYGMSITYEDWEVIDEPLFDILCGWQASKNVPQKFLQKGAKK